MHAGMLLPLGTRQVGRPAGSRRAAAATPPPPPPPPSRGRRSAARAGLQGLDVRPLGPEQLRSLQQQDPQQDAAEAAAALRIPPVAEWGRDAALVAGCEPERAPLRVAVLVSGGVDSSLALQLVAAAGHKPTAFYLQIWFQEDFRNFWDSCPWEEDLEYARKVCDALGVPLVVVPLTAEYWERVVSHSVGEIKAGRTPNPDMLCNSRVKFGAFVEFLEREHGGSFDRIASGHYARVWRPPPEQAQQQPSQQQQQQQQQHRPQLLEGAEAQAAASLPRAAPLLCTTPDAVKDQTYFLAHLSPAQLARCMFPLGGFTKPQVRALAAAAGLATSARKDSQGICFLGKVKFAEFVAEHLGRWPGPLVEEETGEVVGLHEGYFFYTVGQRGGIKLPGGPWYVTSKDMGLNVVYVSKTYYERQRRRDAFVCGPFSWLSPARPDPRRPLRVKVRHGPASYTCSLEMGTRDGVLARAAGAAASGGAAGAAGEAALDHGLVVLSGNDQGLAAGQYAVFYQDGVCLGCAQMLGDVAAAVAAAAT